MTYKNYIEYAMRIRELYEDMSIIGMQPHIESLFSSKDSLELLTEDEYYNKLNTDESFYENMEQSLKDVYVNKKELYRLYMEWVNQVAEDCDWVTSFGPEEIVNSIANILENNPDLIVKNC